MSDQTRGVLFVVLVVAITFVWFHFYQPPVPPQKPVQNAATAPAQSAGPSAPPQAAASPAAEKGKAKPASIPTIKASAERFVTVESGLYRVELSNNGGVVRSWKLKKYFDDQKTPHPLDLVNPDVSEELGWPFSLMLSDKQLEKQANSALYQVTVNDSGADVAGKGASPPPDTLEAPVS
jgi:YidC/Oxa1 family membrane protein insertase